MTTVAEIDTPSLILDLDRLEANIRRGQAMVDKHGLKNRPHIKTHKIPAIGKMQIAAGAVGITCQKIGEVEVFVDAGVAEDILLSYNVLGEAKLERLMALIPRVKRLAVVADNEVVIKGLSDAGKRHGQDVRLLIECDTGFGRNGVQTPEAALSLARYAMNMPRIQFEGLMTFPNQVPKTAEFLNRALELFKAEGIPVPVVSGGGTPALLTLDKFPMLTEHRPGTYVYNDVMMVHSGVATFDDCALTVRTTVVSTPTADRAVIDAGSKVLTREQYYVENFGRIVEYPDIQVVNMSEEHGMLDMSKSATRPKVGEVINIIPNHSCVTTNMMDEIYGVRNGKVETVFPVAARGKVR